MGIFLQENGTFRLLARKLLVLGISAPHIASFYTIDAHHLDHCSHLISFCSFNRDYISPYVITRSCIDDFDWTALSRQIGSNPWLIYFKMLVHTKSHVAIPSFLFTVGTVIGIIIALCVLLRLTGFLIGFCINLEHVLHKGHALIVPKPFVGLLGLRGLTCCCLKGLTIAIIATAVQGVAGLVRTAMCLAMLAKHLTVTLLRDLTSWVPRHLALGLPLASGRAVAALPFALSFSCCFSTMTRLIASRSGSNTRVDSGTVVWMRLYWFCHVIGTDASMIAARSALPNGKFSFFVINTALGLSFSMRRCLT